MAEVVGFPLHPASLSDLSRPLVLLCEPTQLNLSSRTFLPCSFLGCCCWRNWSTISIWAVAVLGPRGCLEILAMSPDTPLPCCHWRPLFSPPFLKALFHCLLLSLIENLSFPLTKLNKIKALGNTHGPPWLLLSGSPPPLLHPLPPLPTTGVLLPPRAPDGLPTPLEPPPVIGHRSASFLQQFSSVPERVPHLQSGKCPVLGPLLLSSFSPVSLSFSLHSQAS